MLYLELLNISEVAIEPPYKGTESFPNKISILDVEDKGKYFNIYYQITSMENTALNLFNNDQLYIIPCMHERRTHAGFKHAKYRDNGGNRYGKDVRYLLPRTFKTLVDPSDESSIDSRIGTIRIYKDLILKTQPRMSRSEYSRFMHFNYTYFNVKIKLDLSKLYTKGQGNSSRGSRLSPRFNTACDTVVFKCTYGQAN